MALVSGRIVATVYNINGTDLKDSYGRSHNWAANQVYFLPCPVGTVAAGVTCASYVILPPCGLNQKGILYLTDSTTTQLVSNGS
jgi:hypothetical protein